MKVKELNTLLNNIDPEAEVFFRNYDEEDTPISQLIETRKHSAKELIKTIVILTE